MDDLTEVALLPAADALQIADRAQAFQVRRLKQMVAQAILSEIELGKVQFVVTGEHYPEVEAWLRDKGYLVEMGPDNNGKSSYWIAIPLSFRTKGSIPEPRP